MEFDTLGKIVRKYVTHPIVKGEKNSCGPEIATSNIHVVIGLATFGYYSAIPFGLL